ncbi:hypothetical protein [Microbulbifer yueqingensis]|uniref:Uncharacterized protein n=1 Tax=Microbulbifer yueqingensis TaxID=658219 RepID=A0A1G8W063_9GAMM|nr:hypothetical protein [Microbulbifer yueqingensis]SDJ71744.1 hypothetical protein SAMN05216212_0816 [Microbulbifer yueqingensis]
MHELHRAEYLQALGVTSYMPRFVLPLAPEPRQAELPPTEAAADESQRASGPLPRSAAQLVEVPAQPSGAATPRPAPQPEVLREVGDITRETRAAPRPSELAPPRQEVAPFVLSCWWLGEELLAVDSREPGAALPVESLFNNIVRALAWHELPREQDRLRWPLAENRFAGPAAASDARDTCSSWLEAASARRPVKSIWLMGAQARDFCSPVALEGPAGEWNGTRLLAMPSLSELLREPARKREVWQLLRANYPEQTRVR